jgi:hypothetical protein
MQPPSNVNIKIPIMGSKTPTQILSSAHKKSTSSFISLSFNLSQTYIYQKDKWALPGNLQRTNTFCLSSRSCSQLKIRGNEKQINAGKRQKDKK